MSIVFKGACRDVQSREAQAGFVRAVHASSDGASMVHFKLRVTLEIDPSLTSSSGCSPGSTPWRMSFSRYLPFKALFMQGAFEAVKHHLHASRVFRREMPNRSAFGPVQ